MTTTALTESLTLALKLKSEVERVCSLLDEKDARIVALAKIADQRRLMLQEIHVATWPTTVHAPLLGHMPTAIRELHDRIAALESELAEALRLKDMHAGRVHGLESELAAKGREVDSMRQRWHDLERIQDRQLTFESVAMELAETEQDRDRERSRREALEREVETLRDRLDESVRLGKYYVKARVYGAVAAKYQSVLEKTDTNAAREALAWRHDNKGGVPMVAVEAIGELLDAATELQRRDQCWHCAASLEPDDTPRHCLDCPADCDISGCQEPGCAILDRSAEQDLTAKSWGIFEPAQKRWWPRRFPTRLAAEEHRAQCSTASTGEVRELPRSAEQDSTGREPEMPTDRLGKVASMAADDARTPSLAPEASKAPEPRRDYLDGAYAPPQPDDLPAGWLKRGLKSAEQDEPHTPDAEPNESLGDMLSRVAKERIDFVTKNREKLLEAWVAEVGFMPSDAVIVESTDYNGTLRVSVERKPPEPRMSASEAHLAGLQDELDAARTSATNWEALARDWQLKFINMRQWVHTLRQNALHGSDYVKVARVLTGKALKGDEAPGYDEATAEVCAAAVRRGEA